MEIDDIKFGNVPEEYLKTITDGQNAKMLSKAKKLGVTSEFINSYPPPKNTDPKTKQELEKMVNISVEADESTKKFCKDIEDDLYKFYVEFCAKLGITYDRVEIEDIPTQYDGILNILKLHFNRPRPAQLAYYLNIPLNPIVNTRFQTPSYPSGHVLDMLLITNELVRRHPEHRETFIELYNKIKDVRSVSGVHYFSDRIGSEKLFMLLKKNGLC